MKKIILHFLWIFALTWMFGCSNDPESTPETVDEIKISADKTIIKANGKDQAQFTITINGAETTSPVSIFQKGESKPVDGMFFSTDSVAAYTFYATYKNSKSNEITIEATHIAVSISVDKTVIKANGKDIVTFTVKIDDKDITSSATIVQKGEPDSIIEKSFFSANKPGFYTLYATYEGEKSNEITIEATALAVTLAVDKASIKANNSDKATFTVNVDGEDVTSSAIITQKKTSEVNIEGSTFFTDESGSYTFYATYEGEKSNEVNIEAGYVELAFLKGYSIIQIASTICPNCPLMTSTLKQVQQGLPNRVHVIALHLWGKYCNSELAGALTQTSEDFADRANIFQIPPPPIAIVDLHYPRQLKQTTTVNEINKAIDESTMNRSRLSETGIAIQSQVNSDAIDFTVKIKSIKDDNYRFFAFIVEDKIIHRQILSDKTWDANFVHNNVGTYILSGADPMKGVDLGKVKAGKETTKAFSINTKSFNTQRDVNLSNCRIIAYTLRIINGVYCIDNVTSCPVNGSVPYLYEQ